MWELQNSTNRKRSERGNSRSLCCYRKTFFILINTSVKDWYLGNCQTPEKNTLRGFFPYWIKLFQLWTFTALSTVKAFVFLDTFQSILFLSKALKKLRYIYRNSHSEVPKEGSQVIANIWIPKSRTHILLLASGSDKHWQRGNFWASIRATGSGWDGGCWTTSLSISTAEAGKEAAVILTWRHL